MLLTIDIGNSHIVSGVFEGQQLRGMGRLSTDKTRTTDEWGTLHTSLLANYNVQPNNISGCIISSVVPLITPTIESMVESVFHQHPLVVSASFPHGLTLRYNHPEEIGPDRIVNAAAAFEKYRDNVIIVDFGTATSFCVVTKHGEFLGGAIALGLKSSADSLHLQTAKLPLVDLVPPKTVIGTTTVSSMQSGLIFGHAGLVDELVTKIQQEIEEKTVVIATGGLASVIAPISRTIQEIKPNLTLEGLELLYRRLHPACG